MIRCGEGGAGAGEKKILEKRRAELRRKFFSKSLPPNKILLMTANSAPPPFLSQNPIHYLNNKKLSLGNDLAGQILSSKCVPPPGGGGGWGSGTR